MRENATHIYGATSNEFSSHEVEIYHARGLSVERTLALRQ
jgi:hypothetical protein